MSNTPKRHGKSAKIQPTVTKRRIMSNQFVTVFSHQGYNKEQQHFLGRVDRLISISPDKEKLEKTQKLIRRILNNNQHNLRDNDINTDEVQVLINLIRPLAQQDIQIPAINNLLDKMLNPMGIMAAASFLSDLTNDTITVGPALLLLSLNLYQKKSKQAITERKNIKELAGKVIAELNQLLTPVDCSPLMQTSC